MNETEKFEDRGKIDDFKANVVALGSSLIVTIDKKSVDFSGVQEGDMVKVWFKIIKKKTDVQQNQ